MAIEDFTTYTETDIPADRVLVAASRVTITALERDEEVHVYKDKGVDHFDGDFEHLATIYLTSSDDIGQTAFWAMTNAADSTGDIVNAGGSYFGVTLYRSGVAYYIYMYEADSGAGYSTSWNGAATATAYYLRIKRDESVGTYGTLYCDVYTSEADRTNEENAVANLSLTLHTSKKDFRYISPCVGLYVGGDYAQSGYTENLDLQEGWTGKFCSVTNPGKINGVSVADIAKVNGVVSS